MIGDAFNHFINEIEIQEKETSFKNNWFLNGNASYLYEMLFDLSSFTGFFYAYKRDEYARYDGAKRLENIKVINPDSYLLFLGNRRIPSKVFYDHAPLESIPPGEEWTTEYESNSRKLVDYLDSNGAGSTLYSTTIRCLTKLYEYLKQEHISYSPPCDLLKSV